MEETKARKVQDDCDLSIDKAIEKSYDYYIVLSSRIYNNKTSINESTCISDYLINNYIDCHQIIKDSFSLDTIENTYFCSIITSNLSITDLTIITSDFQYKKCQITFNWIYSIIQPKAKLSFKKIRNRVLSKLVLNKQIEKETDSIKNLIEIINNVKYKNDLSKLIFLQHNSIKKNDDDILLLL